MFETKIAMILREDLAVWQKLNVTAFLMSGVVAGAPEVIGEAYFDRDGREYHRLSVQPVVVLAADAAQMAVIHRRSLERGVQTALFIEEMFLSGHDGENRAVFSGFGPDDAKVVGIGLRADRKVVDKITKGAGKHP
ncbi:DUF2000 family protein [Novispirillum itersonii]|uniref:DUF2000 family protein n=1 Tax=Novispirillum itersonii TaxID=189 RepID=A0A7X0DNJ6_NOVIT|nr:DUF2000 family protein [Novispirillum itersonii]MBB6211444.1 hypothetical protein [Novispirillum itersonii]